MQIRKLIAVTAFIIQGLIMTPHAFSETATEGKALYERYCAACHKPAQFTGPAFWRDNTDREIAEIIKNGKGKMPRIDLSDEQIKAIIAYMSQELKK